MIESPLARSSFKLASNFPWLQPHLFGNPIVAAFLAPKDAETVVQGKIAEFAYEAIAEEYVLAPDAAKKGKGAQG